MLLQIQEFLCLSEFEEAREALPASLQKKHELFNTLVLFFGSPEMSESEFLLSSPPIAGGFVAAGPEDKSIALCGFTGIWFQKRWTEILLTEGISAVDKSTRVASQVKKNEESKGGRS